MAIKTKGTPEAVVESIVVDRVGFVNASIRKTFASPDILSGGLPASPMSDVLGAIWTRTTVEAEGGIATVRWLYEGLGSWVQKEIYLYEWQGSFESVPIQAHPQYKSWLGVYGTEDFNGTFRPFRSLPDTSSRLARRMKDQLRNPLLGVESFLVSGGVWSMRYAATALPVDLMSGIGLIAESVPGPVPSVPSDRNWLKGAPVMTWRGNAWDVTEQYILSGRGGWASIVYDGTTESGAMTGGGSSGSGAFKA